MVDKVILERDLERYFSNRCAKLGLITLKLNVKYNRGWPDRLVLKPTGQVLWVELKRPTGIVSKLQERQFSIMEEHGHTVHIAKSKEDIDRVLGTS